jgi:hypothetical protein
LDSFQTLALQGMRQRRSTDINLAPVSIKAAVPCASVASVAAASFLDRMSFPRTKPNPGIHRATGIFVVLSVN